MEEASLYTTRKHLFIFTQYYDKHGVPPTKRLFRVAMLDPSPEFIGHLGMFGDPSGTTKLLWAKDPEIKVFSCCVDDQTLGSQLPFVSTYIKARKSLKEQKPSEQSALESFCSKEITLMGGMIRYTVILFMTRRPKGCVGRRTVVTGISWLKLAVAAACETFLGCYLASSGRYTEMRTLVSHLGNIGFVSGELRTFDLLSLMLGFSWAFCPTKLPMRHGVQESNEITFQTTHLEVVLLYLALCIMK
ncbi:hypothetical protein Tco_0590123 [Tanacetum coccineum]